MSQVDEIKARLSRRDFLKLAAAGVVGLAVSSWEPALGGSDALAQKETPAPKAVRPKCKAGPEGRILISEDGGKSWQVAANFGPEYSVRRVAPQRKAFRADLIFQGKKIILISADGRLWRTSGFQAPA
jgi:hypothetical protein